MIAAALTFLRGVPPRLWLLAGLLAAFIVVGGYCSLRATSRERGRQAEATAEAALKTERRNGAAHTAAADERLADERSITDLERKLNDAVAPLPDARPSDRRRALACQRLRNDPDADRDAVAARCGPEGGAQTAPRP
jgi:hypothetical protein